MMLMVVGDFHYTDLGYSYDAATARDDELADLDGHARMLLGMGWRVRGRLDVVGGTTPGGALLIFRREASAADPALAKQMKAWSMESRPPRDWNSGVIRITGAREFTLLGETSEDDSHRTRFRDAVESAAACGWKLTWREEVPGGSFGVLARHHLVSVVRAVLEAAGEWPPKK